MDDVEKVWIALKEQCCSAPKEAKRCVMVSQSDLAAALSAADLAPRADLDAVKRELTGVAVRAETAEKLRCDAATKAANLAVELDAVKAENAKLRDDAARYGWLRDHSCPPHNFYVSVPDEFHGVRYSRSDVDAYIDAARQALGADNER